MKKFYSILALVAVAAMTLISCSKDSDTDPVREDGVKMKTIKVRTGIATKTTLDSDHSNLIWSTGDKISLFNDADNTNTSVSYSAGGDIEVEVPAATTEIYMHYPYYNGNTSGPTSVSVYINPSQTQTNPGELNGNYFPMVAKGTVSSDNKAIAQFYPVAGALALNIYNTALSGTETVQSVKVTPDAANTGFVGSQTTDLTGNNIKYTSTSGSNTSVTVTLTNGLALSNSAPADKKTFDGQIYVCLAKQSYASVKFEITTDKYVYTITSSSTTAFDLVNKDFIPVNINLAKAKAKKAYEESFASDQGNFTIENVTLPSALTYVWSHSSNYMKASAYVSGAYEASSRLVSPILQLGDAPVLSFSHAANFLTNKANVKAAFFVQIKKQGESSWSNLTLGDDLYPDGASWTFVDATVDLSANYANENVQIAFLYTSTSSLAGTWEVKNFKVEDAELLSFKAFNVTTASPIEVPATIESGTTYPINIVADGDVSWTASITEGDATALSLSPASGTGNGTVNLTIGNNTGSARSWKIAIVSSDYVATPSFEIQVVQAKGTTGNTTDEITYSFIGVSGTSYSNWTGKAGASGAVYAGQSAGGNNAIQLRGTSPSGIITTTSGGYAKKVTITWNANTPATTEQNRTLSVYGKNTAYSETAELYNNSNQGTLLGEFVSTSSTTELTISGNYQYVGIRSKSGALYLDGIDIEWGTNAAATYGINIDSAMEHGTVTASKTTEIGAGESVTLTVSPSSGYQLESLTVDGTDVTTSVSNKKYTFDMPAHDVNVTATFCLIPTYSITVDSGIENGTVTPSKTTGITAGESVTLTISPTTGYALETLTVNGTNVTSSVSANTYTFSMPASDVTVSATFIVSTNNTSNLNFTAACGGTGTADDGAVWTVASDGTESNFDNDKGIHYGTSKAEVKYITLTTSDITGTITKVVVNASVASGVSATVSVTVGGEAFGGDAQTLSTSATNYTFNGSASGKIVVTVTKPQSATKALYVKSVAVTH